MKINTLIDNFKSFENKKEADFLQRFFKCGKGEYAEGDIFLGIRVPTTRRLIKGYEDTTPETISAMVVSPYHEIRLGGLLLWVKQMNTAIKKQDIVTQEKIYNLYWKYVNHINNWDLVDLSARDIVGGFLYHQKQAKAIDVLLQKTKKNHLWTQRIAIVSTYYFIQKKEYYPTFVISKSLMHHSHDLIHKACGWMIREVGKRVDAKIMKNFVETHAMEMPRTMLRYAIEHCTIEERKYFMNL